MWQNEAEVGTPLMIETKKTMSATTSLRRCGRSSERATKTGGLDTIK